MTLLRPQLLTLSHPCLLCSWDSSVAASSQAALFVILAIYYMQLHHVRQRFGQAVFFMRMLTCIIQEELHVFSHSNGFVRKIICLPYLHLGCASNVYNFYALRRYVQVGIRRL